MRVRVLRKREDKVGVRVGPQKTGGQGRSEGKGPQKREDKVGVRVRVLRKREDKVGVRVRVLRKREDKFGVRVRVLTPSPLCTYTMVYRLF